MKTYLKTALCLLAAFGAFAAKAQQRMDSIPNECAWSEEQQIIRKASTLEDIEALKGKDLNREYPCGGSILQLATLRGNRVVLFELLLNRMINFDTKVSLKDYPIPGSSDPIPAILFAARYAPNQEAFQTFLDAGLDPYVTDDNGHNIWWYMDQNPVLRESDITNYPEDSLTTFVDIEAIRESQGL